MAQIVDMYGQPIQRDVLSEPQTSKLGWITRDFAQHPSRRLTPKKLHSILEAAEYGDLMAQSDLFTDMEERDAHLFADMSKRKRALLTLDWNIVAPANASTEEKKQAAQLEEWFTDLANLDDVLFDQMDAVGHGFSAQEIEWHQVEKVWLPKTLTHRPQRWFRTPLYDGNDLRLRDNSSDGQPLWPFGWLVHKHRAKSGYLTRAGLHRVLAWPYLFKTYAVSDLAEFLEIYGLPLRVGKYPPGSTKEEKATLLRAVAEIGHNAAGIIPEGMLIEFKEAADGTKDPFEAMINWCEKSVSKAILGGTLTSQADGKTSTNALGKTHNEVRQDLLISDARQAQRTLTNLCYMLSALNCGASDPRRCPRFEFDTRDAEDLARYADALPKLVGAGMKIGRQWAQDKLMIPEPKDGEDILTVPKPQMALPPEERADEPPRTAKMRYRAVLRNSAGEIVYPDQDELDQTVAALPADAITEALRATLGPAIAALRRGATPDEAIEMLIEAQPEMDDTAMQELLARCIFVADVWGRLNGG
ncbi:DUF935 domain-containing protein [Burkholderia mayonis]|uniref:DUF935 domain-containing protein n=1 Tax=Burkholderia mayonis TaxID=1385591 RepID=A0A1B4G3U8_9BURK|nr:DUF935 domain-containing protein [Burkholderia mayonis]AOJ10590.1 hypothetical protein WS71_25780 [Burkholderia mayonis]KVE53219.1 hypothetical protein WS71_08150 [Burkholderia mayonis]